MKNLAEIEVRKLYRTSSRTRKHIKQHTDIKYISVNLNLKLDNDNTPKSLILRSLNKSEKQIIINSTLIKIEHLREQLAAAKAALNIITADSDNTVLIRQHEIKMKCLEIKKNKQHKAHELKLIKLQA